MSRDYRPTVQVRLAARLNRTVALTLSEYRWLLRLSTPEAMCTAPMVSRQPPPCTQRRGAWVCMCLDIMEPVHMLSSTARLGEYLYLIKTGLPTLNGQVGSTLGCRQADDGQKREKTRGGGGGGRSCFNNSCGSPVEQYSASDMARVVRDRMREAAWGLAEHAASKEAAKALLDDTSSVTPAAAHSSLTCRVETDNFAMHVEVACMLHVCRTIQRALGRAVLDPWTMTKLGFVVLTTLTTN